MANRFPLIVDSATETVRELAVNDNIDLTSSNIYNNGAVLTLPTVTGTLATLAGTETLTNKTITSQVANTSIVAGTSSFDLLTTTATTLNIGSAATTLSVGSTASTSSTTNIVTGAVGSGNTKTVNIATGGAASSTTNVNIGSTSGGTVTVNSNASLAGTLGVTGNVSLSADLDIAGGDITSSSSTFNLLNSSVTTATAFNSATTINLGAGVATTLNIGSTSQNNTVNIRGNGTTGITTLSTNVTTGTANIFTGVTGTVNIANSGAASINLGGANSTTTLGGGLVVAGNLTVNGTTTTVNSTVISVDDINIELGSTASPTDAAASGGGITLKGTTDKTIIWDVTNTNWTSSENWNLATGKVYKINNASVLSSTTLGSSVVTSSLTSVGTIGTGVWQGTVINSTYGGTGVNNGGRTITLNTGNLTLTAQAGGSSVTVPSTGTLATLAGTETLTNKSIAASSNTITGLTNSNLSGSAGITNANLQYSTISGVALGSSLYTLTVSTGLGLDSGTTYNGSANRTITNTDRGSSQNIFKNITVAGQPTITAASNNDTFTLAAGSGMSISTDSATKVITFVAGAGGWVQRSSNVGANVGESIIAYTTNGTWTLTLPATPAPGSQITVVDGDDFQKNPLILGRNGNLINKAASDVALNYTGIKVDIIYNGSSWLVYGNTPSGADVLALGLAIGDEF